MMINYNFVSNQLIHIQITGTKIANNFHFINLPYIENNIHVHISYLTKDFLYRSISIVVTFSK